MDKILSWLLQSSNLSPNYEPNHCLVVKKASGGCTACADSCPHQAITIKRMVEINAIDCSGCGLCVHACPSQALSPDVHYQAHAPVKCSRVKGNAQSVICLGRLQASDILQLAGSRGHVTLVHNDCANCSIGTAAIPKVLESTITEAETLAHALGKTINQENDTNTKSNHEENASNTKDPDRSNTIQVHVWQREQFNTTDDPAAISRRELLRGGWRNVQHSAADALAPLERFAGKEEAHALPLAHQKKLHILSLADLLPDDDIDFALPRVADGCIMCPVCSNVCPTQAFSRQFNDEESILLLEPERCHACRACVDSCPRHVITLENPVKWQEIQAGTQEAYRKKQASTIAGVART